VQCNKNISRQSTLLDHGSQGHKVTGHTKVLHCQVRQISVSFSIFLMSLRSVRAWYILTRRLFICRCHIMHDKKWVNCTSSHQVQRDYICHMHCSRRTECVYKLMSYHYRNIKSACFTQSGHYVSVFINIIKAQKQNTTCGTRVCWMNKWHNSRQTGGHTDRQTYRQTSSDSIDRPHGIAGNNSSRHSACFLAECRKRQPNQRTSLLCCILYCSL